MTDFPFIVRGKVCKVRAPTYNNALDRVLYKNPNHFIKTKFAKRMSLIEAEDAAKKETKISKKQRIFVVTDPSGEADFSTTIKVGETAHSVFVGGKKVELTEAELAGATRIVDKNAANKPSVEKVRGGLGKIIEEHKKLISKTKNQETMAKPTKAAPAKKEKKAKKATSERKPVKVEGAKKSLSVKEMRDLIKKGSVIRNAKGFYYSELFLSTKKDQAKKHEVFVK